MFRLISLRLLESYFRHRWLYLLPVLLMTIIAAVAFFTVKPKYIARGVLFVQKQSLLARLTSITGTDLSWQTAASVTTGELRELLQTEAFIRAVIKGTELESRMAGGQEIVKDTIDEARKAIWVSSIGDNQIMIGAIHKSPPLTLQLVNGVIQTFIQWKINGDRSDSEAAHVFFSDLIASYKTDVDLARQNLYDYLFAHPAPFKGERPAVEQLEITRLESELRAVQTRYTNALDKDENARLAAAQAQENIYQSYVVIDSPQLPAKPEMSIRKLVLQYSSFILAGVILSFVAVAGGAILDRSFRFPIDVWYGVNLPVLGTIPAVAADKTNKKAAKRKAAKSLPVLEPVTSKDLAGAAAPLLLVNENHPEHERDGLDNSSQTAAVDQPVSNENSRRRRKSKSGLADEGRNWQGKGTFNSYDGAQTGDINSPGSFGSLNISLDEPDIWSTGSTR